MIPTRACTRASAASTSSIACTQAASETTARIRSLPRLGPKSRSDGKEHRLLLALQTDVEVQHAAIVPGDERRSPGRFDRVEDGIAGVRRLVGKIHPGHQVAKKPARKDGDIDVGSLGRTVRRRARRFRDDEMKRALRIGPAPAEADTWFPDLEESIGDRRAMAVDDLPFDTKGAGTPGGHRLFAAHIGKANPEKGADRLRRRHRQAHRCSSSNGVASRPRSTMSHW